MLAGGPVTGQGPAGIVTKGKWDLVHSTPEKTEAGNEERKEGGRREGKRKGKREGRWRVLNSLWERG